MLLSYVRLLHLLTLAVQGVGDLWDFVRAEDSSRLLRAEALAWLAAVASHRPALQLKDVKLSRFGDCKVVNWIKQVEVHIPQQMPKCAADARNSTDDIILIPHCISSKLTYLEKMCQQGHYGASEAAWPQYFACGRKMQQAYLNAWSGAIRNAGPNSAVVLGSHFGRQENAAYQQLPRVISYYGPSRWILDKLAEVGSLDTRCEEDPGANGQYPSHWPQDVVISPLPWEKPFNLDNDWAPADGRSVLFTFLGSNTHWVREDILLTWNQSHESDIRVGEPLASTTAYKKVLRNTRYCLVPQGHVTWSYRFMEVLLCGCVPVIIACAWHPPFHRLLRWADDDFPVVYVSPHQIPDLRSVLSSIGNERYRAMQELTLPLATFLDSRYSFFYGAVLAELAMQQSGWDKRSRGCRCGMRRE